MKLMPRFLPLTTVLCLALLVPAVVLADDWRPLDPADVALKGPVVEKDADAEAIVWEVRVADNVEGGTRRTVFSHYGRI